MKPCAINANNIIDMGLFFISAWMHICSIINILSDNFLFSIILLGIGAFIILVITIILHFAIKKKIH